MIDNSHKPSVGRKQIIEWQHKYRMRDYEVKTGLFSQVQRQVKLRQKKYAVYEPSQGFFRSSESDKLSDYGLKTGSQKNDSLQELWDGITPSKK